MLSGVFMRHRGGTARRMCQSIGGCAKQPAFDEMLHRYFLDQAHQHFDARRKAIAAIKTPDGHRAATEGAASVLSASRSATCPSERHSTHGWSARLKRDGYRVEKVIFESRPEHHVTANLYLPEGHRLSRACSCRAVTATTARLGRAISVPASCWPRTAWPCFCYDPIGQGERYQMLDAKGKPSIRGTTEHTMAGIGALLVGRAAGELPDLGRHSGTRLPGEPARGRSDRAGLHGQLGRRHDDGLPDGPRRSDRRGGAFLLHHVARTALRHDRSAGRRAEHHRPGRRRHGTRRLHHDAGTQADVALRGHARLLRHPGELGYVSRSQADLRPARVRRARRSVRVGRAARLHHAPGAVATPAG